MEVLGRGDLEIIGAGDGELGARASAESHHDGGGVRPEERLHRVAPARGFAEELDQVSLLFRRVVPPVGLDADLAAERDALDELAGALLEGQVEDQGRYRRVRLG